tara:strand:- start:237 stop:1076 length:840 start_codon:yes stop_codon:yes gene_type:complete
MAKGVLEGITKAVQTVAGGAVNRTLDRLRGSGIQGDSRLVKTKAKWYSRSANKDWRVRLQVPLGSPLESFFFENNELLQPLRDSRGFFWPLTPTLIMQHSASYNALAQVHSNYPAQAYQNSRADMINIIGEFPVQNQQDAKYWVAVVHFLRTATKMFFGNDDGNGLKGSPPPIMHLSGYGDHMFQKVPVVITTMNVELPAGVDYISTKQNDIYNELPHAEEFARNQQNAMESQTWAPTLSNISVGLEPIYSRDSVSNFSMSKFVKGELNGKGRNEIGFI